VQALRFELFSGWFGVNVGSRAGALCALVFAAGCSHYGVDAACRERCDGAADCRDDCIAFSTSQLHQARALGCEPVFDSYLSCLRGGSFAAPACRFVPAELWACGLAAPVGVDACDAEEILFRTMRSLCDDGATLMPPLGETACAAGETEASLSCWLSCADADRCEATEESLAECHETCSPDAQGV